MIVIIAATGNNLMSIENAIKRLGHPVTVSNDIDTINKATHVILPGVGTSKMGMRQLEHYGLIPIIRQLTCPVLGICLGMQLLFDYSEEDNMACLGIIQGRIKALRASTDYPIPHMGWNQLQWLIETPLCQRVPSDGYVYFVHGYAAELSEGCLAQTEYSQPFTAVVQHHNFYGMQFHPEKSARVGAQLLENFCAL